MKYVFVFAVFAIMFVVGWNGLSGKREQHPTVKEAR